MKTNLNRNKKPKDFTPSVGCSSNDTMKNNKNNESKDNQVVLFPDDLSKCFFAMEKEFQPFEIQFLINQFNRRSSIEINEHKLKTVGSDFMIWFTEHIMPDLAPMGAAVCLAINAKMKRYRDRFIISDSTIDYFKEVDVFIKEYVK